MEPIPEQLAAALAFASRVMPSVAKSGTAPGAMGGYAYRSIDDVTAAARAALNEARVVIIPTDGAVTMEGWGDRGWHRCTVRMTFTLVHESGEAWQTEIVGSALDNSDKGLGKARSYALKELLTRLFLMGTGDDIEATDTTRGRR